jgi:hypothetical protein
MGKHRLQMQRRPASWLDFDPTKVVPEPADLQPQRINQYTCRTCGGVITTVDRNEGTTPWMLACRATDGCTGSMFSSMYRVAPYLTPEWEWYKPEKLPKGEMREHVQMGGLLLRKIEAK